MAALFVLNKPYNIGQMPLSYNMEKCLSRSVAVQKVNLGVIFMF